MRVGRVYAGPGAAIFAIFFAIGLVRAITAHEWAGAVFWTLIGLLFVFADNVGARRRG